MRWVYGVGRVAFACVYATVGHWGGRQLPDQWRSGDTERQHRRACNERAADLLPGITSARSCVVHALAFAIHPAIPFRARFFRCATLVGHLVHPFLFCLSAGQSGFVGSGAFGDGGAWVCQKAQYQRAATDQRVPRAREAGGCVGGSESGSGHAGLSKGVGSGSFTVFWIA